MPIPMRDPSGRARKCRYPLVMCDPVTINSHIKTFAGLPVVEFEPDSPDGASSRVDDPAAVAWRISVDVEDPPADLEELLRRLISVVGAASISALVIGEWGESYETAAPLAVLARECSALPRLRALFIGELTYTDCEISWIQQGDVTDLLMACPKLEVLRVRGGTGLELRPVRHRRLRELAFETGGLPAGVVRAVGECDLPALEHLELWLGISDYGGDATTADLAGVLTGALLPALRILGLRDADIADEVAAAIATAPVVTRLTDLDLSLGTLSDVGAAALLSGQKLTHLSRLNLSHHYVSDELAGRLRAELPGVEIDLSGVQEVTSGYRERYVAVGE